MYGDGFIYILGGFFGVMLATLLGLVAELIWGDWATTMSVWTIATILGWWIFLGGRRE